MGPFLHRNEINCVFSLSHSVLTIRKNFQGVSKGGTSSDETYVSPDAVLLSFVSTRSGHVSFDFSLDTLDFFHDTLISRDWGNYFLGLTPSIGDNSSIKPFDCPVPSGSSQQSQPKVQLSFGAGRKRVEIKENPYFRFFSSARVRSEFGCYRSLPGGYYYFFMLVSELLKKK